MMMAHIKTAIIMTKAAPCRLRGRRDNRTDATTMGMPTTSA